MSLARLALPVSLLALGACKDEPITVVTPPSAQASATGTPADHLAPNELLEGKASAFGLVLPMGVHIDAAFSDVVYASGHVADAAVVKYVRARVSEGKLIRPAFAGNGQTVFDHVLVPTSPGREFVVKVGAERGAVASTTIEIRDVTPTKAPSLPDDTARWRSAGLAPNGTILDPSHLQ